METNRDYFSWSQYYLWKSSKLQFYKRYVLGETGPKLKAFDKGKEFGNYKETGDIPHWVSDPLLQQVGDDTPSLEIMEHELKVDIFDTTLLCYLDTCDLDLTNFYEYKTGKNKWTQSLVNKHEQLDFYAFCIYVMSNEEILPTCTLYWIETEEIEMPDGSSELRYTGRIEKFERTFTEEDMVNMGTKISMTLTEIKNHEHVELELSETLVNRYIKLAALEKKIKSELNIIKLEVHNNLKTNGVKYGLTSNGRFSISERKSYIYSSDLIVKETEYKTEIDKLKKQEKDSGTATVEISESLRFNLVK